MQMTDFAIVGNTDFGQSCCRGCIFSSHQTIPCRIWHSLPAANLRAEHTAAMAWLVEGSLMDSTREPETAPHGPRTPCRAAWAAARCRELSPPRGATARSVEPLARRRASPSTGLRAPRVGPDEAFAAQAITSLSCRLPQGLHKQAATRPDVATLRWNCAMRWPPIRVHRPDEDGR